MDLQFYQNLVIGMSIFAVALLIASCAAPVWIWLEPDNHHVGVGLFDRVGWETDGASTFSVTDVKFLSDDTKDTRHWTVIAGLEVTAAVLAFLLLPLIYRYLQGSRKVKTMKNYIQAILFVTALAWLCNVIGLLLFAMYHGDALTEAPDVSSNSFSWGAFMAFFAACAHFWIFYIVHVIFRNGGDGRNNIPLAADPKMSLYPSTKNAMMNRFFQGAPYANGRLPIEDADDFNRSEPRMTIMPPDDLNDRRELIPVPMAQRFVVDNNVDRFQPVVRELDNRQHLYSSRIERPAALRNATVLQARDMDEVNGEEDEIVFRKVNQPRGNRDLESADYIVRKNGGDFLVPAKHSTDRDVYRTEKYLVHTSKPSEEVSDGQRLVLSPSNFTETNVKYNPTYMYRPYSERVY